MAKPAMLNVRNLNKKKSLLNLTLIKPSYKLVFFKLTLLQNLPWVLILIKTVIIRRKLTSYVYGLNI